MELNKTVGDKTLRTPSATPKRKIISPKPVLGTPRLKIEREVAKPTRPAPTPPKPQP